MATSRSRQNSLYGFPNPLANQFPAPYVRKVDPTAFDDGEIGQMWINTTSNVAFSLTSRSAGVSTWSTSVFGGVNAPVFTITGGDLTVQNPGNIIVDTGDITATAGDITAGGNIQAANIAATNDIVATNDITLTNGDLLVSAGNIDVFANSIIRADLDVQGDLDVTGTITAGAFAGTFDLISPNQIEIKSTFNGADAIKIWTDGGTAETLHLNSNQGTGVNSVLIDSTVGGVTITAARANASAMVISASNPIGGILVNTGTGGMAVNLTNGPFLVETGTGDIDIGTDAVAKAITIGNVTGATTVVIGAGTGASGFLTTGVGTLTLNTVTGALGISTNADATTVNIGTGAAVVKTIAIGGTGANVITIGNTQTAGSVAIGTAMTTGTISIGGTGLQTGTVNIAIGTGAQAINLGTGGTGVKTISIGTGAIGNIITIGSLTAAASLTLRGGTGGITLNAAGHIIVTPGTDTQASPSATAVINTEVFKATFTGFTTASTASQVFIITNATIAATSGILVSASTLGANDAQMTITRVLPGAGTVSITLKNNGAAAVNGNIIITGFVIN